MKKRLFALTLVLALALSIAIPALASDTAATGTATYDYTTFEVGSYTSYGIAVDTGTVSWKAIKTADLTLDGYMDVSKLIKKAGVVYFAELAATDFGSYKTQASATSLVTDGKAVQFAVSAPPTFKPTTKKPTSFTDIEAIFTNAEFEGTEWAFANSRDWHSLDSASPTSIVVEMKAYKQTIWVRKASVATASATSATATSAPSAYTKLTVPAYTKAPVLKASMAKGTVAIKDSYEVVIDGYEIVIPSGTKVLELGAEYTAADGTKLTLELGLGIQVRIPADTDKNKAPSEWTYFFLDYMAVSDPVDVTEDFALTAKGQILVVGDKTIEMYDATSNKWKKVKKFTAETLKDNTLVRTSGTATKWPGEAKTIKYDATTKAVIDITT